MRIKLKTIIAAAAADMVISMEKLRSSVKIRLGSGLWLVNVLVVLLVVAVNLVPWVMPRTILGVPFVLFFPGYALTVALFPRQASLDALARTALGLGVSLALSALIGLALNYTSWGLRLETVLYSQAAFIFAISGIALWRWREVSSAERYSINIDLSWLSGTSADRRLSLVLATSVVLALGVLVYSLLVPVVGEAFTEFYLLGPDGKARDYPSAFTLEGDRVVLVQYGEGREEISGSAVVLVGITNAEQSPATYTIRVNINGEPLSVIVGEAKVAEIGPVELKNGEKWQKEIRFVPLRSGERQKVEFVLYKNGIAYFESPPHIWIDVRQK